MVCVAVGIATEVRVRACARQSVRVGRSYVRLFRRARCVGVRTCAWNAADNDVLQGGCSKAMVRCRRGMHACFRSRTSTVAGAGRAITFREAAAGKQVRVGLEGTGACLLRVRATMLLLLHCAVQRCCSECKLCESVSECVRFVCTCVFACLRVFQNILAESTCSLLPLRALFGAALAMCGRRVLAVSDLIAHCSGPL